MEVSRKKIDAYHAQALAVSTQSPDSQTQVGCILINSTTGAVLGSGFNGFVRSAPDDKLPTTRPDKYPYIIHAETNMVYNCARHGVPTDNCFVYCTLSPCVNCLRALYQSGISVVFFKDKYRDFNENVQMKDLFLKLEKVYDDYHKICIYPRLP